MAESCKYTYKTGKRAGERCAVKPRAGEMCSEHTKRHKVNPDVAREITGAPRASETKKRHSSMFKITINTNTSAARMSVADVRAFKVMIREIFAEGNVEGFLLDLTNPADAKANILTLESQMFFEHGEQRHMVHAHGWVKLIHTGNYKMNLAALRAVAAGVYGRNIHLDVKGEALNDVVWEEYARKHAAAERIV